MKEITFRFENKISRHIVKNKELKYKIPAMQFSNELCSTKLSTYLKLRIMLHVSAQHKKKNDYKYTHDIS